MGGPDEPPDWGAKRSNMTPEEIAALDHLTDEAVAPCIQAVERLGVTVSIEDQEALSDWLQSRFRNRLPKPETPGPMKKWRVELTRLATISERTDLIIEARTADEAEDIAIMRGEAGPDGWSEIDGTHDFSLDSYAIGRETTEARDYEAPDA